jgi:GMP synthase PP-ATPase subunit
MSKATTMRRTFTTRHTQDDDSVCVSTASSTSYSGENTQSSKNNTQGDVVTNTSATETGKYKKESKEEKLETQVARWDDGNQSTIEEKIKQFIKQLENHKDPKKSKKDLVEEFIRTNASESFMRKMTKISDKEIAHLKGNTPAKWVSILASGVISQWTSRSEERL